MSYLFIYPKLQKKKKRHEKQKKRHKEREEEERKRTSQKDAKNTIRETTLENGSRTTFQAIFSAHVCFCMFQSCKIHKKNGHHGYQLFLFIHVKRSVSFSPTTYHTRLSHSMCTALVGFSAWNLVLKLSPCIHCEWPIPMSLLVSVPFTTHKWNNQETNKINIFSLIF